MKLTTDSTNAEVNGKDLAQIAQRLAEKEK
jgi:hypothetical protein